MYMVKQCPVLHYVSPLNSQWGMPLLAELTSARTFHELKQALAPITNRMLSHILRSAQKASCVTKTSNRYLLTERGMHLFATLRTFTTPTCKTCSGFFACCIVRHDLNKTVH